MANTSPPHPTRPARPNAFQRLPLYLYRGPLANVLHRRFVLLLTTRGRTSGKPRQTPLTYMPLGERIILYAGARGTRADWYRNLLANPDVSVQLGRRRVRARAYPVQDPARRRELATLFVEHQRKCGPPAPIKWARRTFARDDCDTAVINAFAHAEVIPIC